MYQVLFLALLPAATGGWAGELKISAYATAGGVNRLLATPEDRARAAAALQKLGVSRVFLEGRRGDEYAGPEVLKAVRDDLQARGFEVSGGIATVPGRNWGTHGNTKFGWLNYESPATRNAIAQFFTENAPLFGELIVDDFYCTMDTTPESEQARGARSWGEYRRDLLVSLIRPMMIEPARAAAPGVRLIVKYPQWYDRFHLFGYDPGRMSPRFDRVWVGTEVRNPTTARFGYVQPTQGYINFRWIASVAADKVQGAWFDHIECTARNFVDQAYQSVLAGARELTLFNLTDILGGHPGHELFAQALPELKELAAKVGGRPRDGIAYYKPSPSDAEGDMFLMDYVGMLGLPVLPEATYPSRARVAMLGVQAAADPELTDKLNRHLAGGAAVIVTPALLRKVPAIAALARGAQLRLGTAAMPLLEARRAGPGELIVWNIAGFSEQDYIDSPTGEKLLPPRPLPVTGMEPALLDSLRGVLLRPLGMRLTGPAGVSFCLFEGASAFYNFHHRPVALALNGRRVEMAANGLAWVTDAAPRKPR